jgi:hypothetical protein
MAMSESLSDNNSNPFPALDPVPTLRAPTLAVVQDFSQSCARSDAMAAPFTLMAALGVSCANTVIAATSAKIAAKRMVFFGLALQVPDPPFTFASALA